MLSRPALNDRQINRMAFRIGLFQRRGLSEAAAERMADRLADRDYERDDRTVCLECKHLQRNNGCFQHQQGRLAGVGKYYQPITDLLQRCPGFAFQTP